MIALCHALNAGPDHITVKHNLLLNHCKDTLSFEIIYFIQNDYNDNSKPIYELLFTYKQFHKLKIRIEKR